MPSNRSYHIPILLVAVTCVLLSLFGLFRVVHSQPTIQDDQTEASANVDSSDNGGADGNIDESVGNAANTTDFSDVTIYDTTVTDNSHLSLGDLIESGQVKSVRILGDSIMSGMGGDGYVDPNGQEIFDYDGIVYHEPSQATDCASNWLREHLGEHGVSLVNASVPGFGSMNSYSHISEDVLGDEDLAIVMLGTNDRGAYDQSETLDDFMAYAERLLTMVSVRYDGKMIVLSPIPVVSEDYNFTLREVSDTLRYLCSERGWTFFSMYDAFDEELTERGVQAPDVYTDGTHPNAMGQQVLWDALRQALALDVTDGDTVATE